MGASLALAGLTGCRVRPAEKIVPYVRAPEEVIPGKSLFFATGSTLCGYAKGILVESHLGRPTKVEGNPQHPASLGATDVFSQASVLTLYDPDRSRTVTRLGQISTWVAFVAAIEAACGQLAKTRGAGLRILSEIITSPSMAAQIQAVLAAFPAAKWHQYEPVGSGNRLAGCRLAFGEDANMICHFDRADAVLSLDADFLGRGPADLRYTRDFVSRRKTAHPSAMNRLYSFESTPSITGSMADHRTPVPAREMEAMAAEIARRVGVPGLEQRPDNGAVADTNLLQAVARDLAAHRGSSLVIAGDHQSALVHALAHAINTALGNIGNTVTYTRPPEANPADPIDSLRELADDMAAGRVQVLIILGGNPVYTAPRDFQFSDRLSKVPLRAHLSLYQDETSALCHWHIPETHFLESWGDARAFDGTVTMIQPLIAPLYEGKSACEVLAALAGNSGLSSHDIVSGYWKSQSPSKAFDEFWRVALHDGLIAGSAFPEKQVRLQPGPWRAAPAGQRPAQGLEIVFQPDATIWDGRFANNGWLQELPKPMTKLAWDNAAMVSPATGRRLNLQSDDLVDLEYRGARVRAAVWILPGQADDSVTVYLGYGRSRGGSLAAGAGFNVYPLRNADRPWFDSDLKILPTGWKYGLVSTQQHFNMENRHLIRRANLAEFLKNPDFARKVEEEPPKELTLYPGFPYNGYAWGMVIDLNACTGCGACVVACQAENNIPVVGKAEVGRGREMHWIRVDRYYEGDADRPASYHQPVPCMQCENAPCELVCPVGATVHSEEGLNQMVYNRCVGTRYCSNNCPYKVRRFNFFQFSDWTTPSLKPLRNPNVTVRSRGVMEKCTYCVQRINAAKIEAEKRDRQVREGEIVTACQAVCPAEAIVFGDINDPASRVAKAKADPRNYGLLTDLNTRPRTTYLARILNPNPDLEQRANHGS